MKIRRHSNKSGQPASTSIGGSGIKSGTLPPTYEQIQSGTGAAGASGAVLVNFIWAVINNR